MQFGNDTISPNCKAHLSACEREVGVRVNASFDGARANLRSSDEYRAAINTVKNSPRCKERQYPWFPRTRDRTKGCLKQGSVIRLAQSFTLLTHDNLRGSRALRTIPFDSCIGRNVGSSTTVEVRCRTESVSMLGTVSIRWASPIPWLSA